MGGQQDDNQQDNSMYPVGTSDHVSFEYTNNVAQPTNMNTNYGHMNANQSNFLMNAPTLDQRQYIGQNLNNNYCAHYCESNPMMNSNYLHHPQHKQQYMHHYHQQQQYHYPQPMMHHYHQQQNMDYSYTNYGQLPFQQTQQPINYQPTLQLHPNTYQQNSNQLQLPVQQQTQQPSQQPPNTNQMEYLNNYMNNGAVPQQYQIQPLPIRKDSFMSIDSSSVKTINTAVECKDKKVPVEYLLQIFNKIYPCKQVSFIGSGGFGNVFRVGDVAVKVIPYHDVETFNKIKKEASRQLDQENILKINPMIHVLQGNILIESEYISGGTLQNLVGALSPKLHWIVLEQLAMALYYMHQQKLIHRDVKLNNVLVRDKTKDSINVVLSDFGLTRSVETISTQAGHAGTKGYMAPELFEKNPDYTPASDVFALGILMITLASGYDFPSGLFGKLMHDYSVNSYRHEISKIFIDCLTHKTTKKMADLICRMLTKSTSERVTCPDIISICREVLLNEKSDYTPMGAISSITNQFITSMKDKTVNFFNKR